MDFKGIRWAGNIYEKFEAMCLEVEEVMYEDTVKYVENQVQKVGVSVKKFYSEVMQDLLPPSSADLEKVAGDDLSLKHYYGHPDDINKKPKLSILDNLKKKETEEDSSDLTAGKASLSVPNNDATTYLHNLLPPEKVVVENTRSELCCTKSKKVGAYRRPIGIKRISQNNHQSPKVSPSARPLSPDHMNKTKSVNENAPLSIASVESLVSDKILSAQSLLRQQKSESQCTSKIYEDEFRQNDLLSQTHTNIGSDPCDVESVGGEVIASYQDNFDMEVIDNEEVIGQGPETFEPVEKSKLEETCILVAGDKLHFVSQTTGKHKSYKKKIREALSYKLRSTKKQHECLSDYKDLSGDNNAGVVVPAHTVDSDKRKLPAHDSLESDWELL